jgi:hypothetical protein
VSERCAYCGGEDPLAHHATGRDPQLRYLDPNLTIPLCHDHHQLVHDDLRAAGVDDPQTRAAVRLSFIECVEVRLRRLAVAIGRLAGKLPGATFLAQLAERFKGWADELSWDLAARDSRDPGWRTDPRFYPA